MAQAVLGVPVLFVIDTLAQRSTFKKLRTRVREAAVAEGQKDSSTNLLTLCVTGPRATTSLNKIPERITPPRCLGNASQFASWSHRCHSFWGLKMVQEWQAPDAPASNQLKR